MPIIPNYPDDLAHEHHAWHNPSAHPGLPTRRFRPPNPGSGLEFLTFHRQYMARFHAWYDTQPFADQAAVAPWRSIPAELKKPELGWNDRWAAAERRILTNDPPFASEDEFGLFIEEGIHNSFLHGATSAAFGEPIVAQLHSPESTFFYKIHGLVDHWWSRFLIGGPVFPPGAGVALANQTPDVLAGLLVTRDGHLHVAHVAGLGEWTHDRISGPVFPPGAGIGMAKQTDGITVGLIVDRDGHLNVAHVAGLGAWRHDRISGPVFPPGAGIGMAKQTADITVGLLVDTAGWLNVAHVVGVGAWRHDRIR